MVLPNTLQLLLLTQSLHVPITADIKTPEYALLNSQAKECCMPNLTAKKSKAKSTTRSMKLISQMLAIVTGPDSVIKFVASLLAIL